MNEHENYFNKALSTFVIDFACKDEVIAKYKRGKDMHTIKKELTFPISIDNIKNIIEKYENEKKETYDFMKVEDEFGNKSFIRINKCNK